MSPEAELIQAILGNLHDGVYIVSPDRKIEFWNASAERITGYQADHVLGRHCFDNLLQHTSDEGLPLCHGMCPLAQTLADGQARKSDVFFQHRDGHRVPTRVMVTPILDAHQHIVGAVEIFQDTTVEMAGLQRVKELERLAMLDPLTQLANRRYVEETIQAHFEEMNRYGWQFGILLIDVDHFKQVNDTYGHAIGDEVLKMVARTLRSNARSFDLVGRWGGEEFIMVADNVNLEKLRRMALRCARLIERSRLEINEQTIGVTISVGGALAGPPDTLESLLAQADERLYHSKASGRNRVSLSAS